MFDGHDLFISELLAERRWVAPDVLAQVRQRQGAGSLAATLVAEGLVDRVALGTAVAEQLGGVLVGDLPARLPDDVVAQCGAEVANRHGIVPLTGTASGLVVAAVDPLRPDLAGDLAFALGRPVRLAVADTDGVRRLLRLHYRDESGPRAVVAGEKATEVPGDRELSVVEIERAAGQGAVVQFVHAVLAQAIKAKASDIHFEPFEREFKLRFRVDGTLLAMPPPARSLALPVISRLKILAQLNITERRRAQDGRITIDLEGRRVDLRVSTLPTQFGESVVLRVLDPAATRLDLAQLGLPEAIRSSLEGVIRQPNGMIAVTGPTGSGKTTSLYSCLRALNSPDAKLLTIEDPVEYEIDGVMQVPVNPAAGLTFARALRTFLRQDPDVVMVGEIRDLETAQIAVQASLTGHLVLTTLHTNDAPSAVTRLLDLGVEPFLLASTLEAVLAQRLVRRICDACRQVVVPSPAQRRLLGLEPSGADFPFYCGAGCAECHHTGYRGRLGLFEYLRCTDTLRELVLRDRSLVRLRRQAIDEGMTTLRAAGIEAVRSGITTIGEILQHT